MKKDPKVNAAFEVIKDALERAEPTVGNEHDEITKMNRLCRVIITALMEDDETATVPVRPFEKHLMLFVRRFFIGPLGSRQSTIASLKDFLNRNPEHPEAADHRIALAIVSDDGTATVPVLPLKFYLLSAAREVCEDIVRASPMACCVELLGVLRLGREENVGVGPMTEIVIKIHDRQAKTELTALFERKEWLWTTVEMNRKRQKAEWKAAQKEARSAARKPARKVPRKAARKVPRKAGKAAEVTTRAHPS